MSRTVLIDGATPLEPAERLGRTTPFSSERLLRSCFVARERSRHGAFDMLEDLVAADADEGGLAKLFVAKLADGTAVAIKRFHSVRGFDQALFEQHCAMAQVEYQRLVELDGAGGYAPVAYALGSFFDENGCEHVAIAMEYIEGYTLEYALRAGFLRSGSSKRERAKTSLRVGSYVARALEACAPCVHRDLSPRNVMLVMDGSGSLERVVLIDFGQAAHAKSSLVTPSAGPHRLATVSFGAPEVFGGPFYGMRNEVSVDVYSLGALLYYVASWRIPFLEEGTLNAATAEGARAIVEAKRSPLDYAAAVEGTLCAEERELSQLIAACTAFDPRIRPSASEVLRELERALGRPSAANAACRRRSPKSLKPTPVWRPEPSEASSGSCVGVSASDLLVLSDNYFYGHGGLPRDVRRSYEALLRAAKLGDASAQFRLGKSLALGRHGAVEPAVARDWLAKAAEAGHPGAASTLHALAL